MDLLRPVRRGVPPGAFLAGALLLLLLLLSPPSAATMRGQDTPAPGVTAATPAAVTPTPTPTPAIAAAATPAPTSSPQVLYPSSNVPNGLNPRPGNDTAATANYATAFLVLLGLCAGGFYLLRRQTGFHTGFKGAPRKLTVSESRSLGNRQFLVVVEYERERMLLGVAPGKIDYLCPLRGPDAGPEVFVAPQP